MLRLDRIKTLTIYSKKQLDQLYREFRHKLQQVYEQQSLGVINNILIFFKLFYFLQDIPHFTRQFNQAGEILFTATLEILFAKSSTWKPQLKQSTRIWIGVLLKISQKYIPQFKAKQQMLSSKIPQQQQIKFFSEALNISARSNPQFLGVIVSFFRVYILYSLQQKKVKFSFVTENLELEQKWVNISNNLMNAIRIVNNLKQEEICVSLSYWLCSAQKPFIEKYLQGGIITFLLRSLVKKGITEWYGRKIIGFLKLLLLESNKNIPIEQLETNLAKFSQIYDNQAVFNLIVDIMRVVESKYAKDIDYDQIQKLRICYDNYKRNKDQNSKIQLLDYLRVLIIYGKGQRLAQCLLKPQNLELLMQMLKQQTNLSIIKQLFFLLANRSEQVSTQISLSIIEKIVEKINSIILTREKDLSVDNKKYLIGYCKILKQLLNRKDIQNKIQEIIQKYQIQQRLLKYSNGKVFNFERHLYQLRIKLHQKNSHKQPDVQNILQVLSQQLLTQKLKKSPQEQDLSQLKLLNGIASRDPNIIQVNVSFGLLKKLYDYGDENSQVSVSILGNSQAQHLRNMKDQINYYALDSLAKLAANDKHKSLLNDENILQKVLKVGICSHNKRVIHAAGDYLRVFLSLQPVLPSQEQNIKLLQNKLEEIEDKQNSEYILSKLKKVQVQVPQKKQSFQQLIEILSNLKPLNKQEINELLSLVNTLQNNNIKNLLVFFKQNCSQKQQNLYKLIIILTIIYKISQRQEFKKIIYESFSTRFLQIYKTHFSSEEIANLLYLIFVEIFEVVPQIYEYFSEILKLSYQWISKESIKFTEECLNQIDYIYSEPRKNIYLKFVYNYPELIAKEAAFILQNSQTGHQDNFWLKFKQKIKQLIQNENGYSLSFFDFYAKFCSNEIWQKHNLNEILQIILKLSLKQISFLERQTNAVQIIRKSKYYIKILLQINNNLNIDISAKYAYQNIILFLQLEILIKQCLKQTQNNVQFKEIILNIFKILILMYKNHQGSHYLLNNINDLKNIFQNSQKIGNQHINDCCLQIMRISLLKDSNQTQYPFLINIFQNFKTKSANLITQIGKEHIIAIQRILEYYLVKNQNGIKKQSFLYFFGRQPIEVTQQQLIITQFTDQQLLKHLKNLFNPPYKYGLNFLIPHIKKIQSNQFANTLVKIYVKCDQFYQQDSNKSTLTLEQTRQKIVDSISVSHTELSEQFYQMINIDKTGMSICLLKKGIGVRGISIVCNRMLQHQKDICFYSEILYLNASTQKQFSVIKQKRIAQLVNKFYNLRGHQSQFGKSLGNLIGASSRVKEIQEVYKVIYQATDNIDLYRNDYIPLASTFYALSGLVYNNPENRKQLSYIHILKLIINLIVANMDKLVVVQKGCNLLSNLIYKNHELIKIYIELQIGEKILQILEKYLNTGKYDYQTIKQILRLIGNLSLDIDISYKLSKLRFMKTCKKLIEKAHKEHNEDIIKYSLDILFNMVNFPDIEAKAIILTIYEEGYIDCFFMILKEYLLNSEIIESSLDSYDCLCQTDVITQKSIQMNIFETLSQIQKAHDSNQSILNKWIRILYKLTYQQKYIYKMLDSNVLLATSNFIRNYQTMKPKTLEIILKITDKVNLTKALERYARSGFIDLLIQILRIKNLQTQQISTILDILMYLTSQKLLNSSFFVKLFESLVYRLHLEYKDQNAKKIVLFIKQIKQRVVINNRTAALVLQQFSYFYLTQKQIITSTKYHKRVREFISLLSYFICFNAQLKLLFKDQSFLSILKNWIKIETLLDQDNTLVEACRVCFFSILNDHKFFVAINSDHEIEKSIFSLSQDKKCLLYRKDGSNKNACIRYDKQKNQIISFKLPNGEIKQKYKIPIKSIINIKQTYSPSEIIVDQSVFKAAFGLFTKQPILKNCLSIFGLVGEQLSIREISVQFHKDEERESFVKDLKIIISRQHAKKDYR